MKTRRLTSSVSMAWPMPTSPVWCVMLCGVEGLEGS